MIKRIHARDQKRFDLAVCGADLLSQGTRDEQRKFIKYNHLIANLLAFHTLVSMTRALQQIQQAGHPIDPAALVTFSPYGTQQYNRFGSYALNPNRLSLAQYLAFQISIPAPTLPD